MATDTKTIQPTARLPVNGRSNDHASDDGRRLPPLDERPKVRRLPPGQHHALADEISGMAESIREVDHRAAERLIDLSHSLSDEENRSRWSDVDLRRAFNTERIAHAWAVKKEGGYASGSIDAASRIRDVLVLLPLAVTWFAFYRASRSYESYLSENPEEAGTPMLVLWERGFGEEGVLVERFSTVALIDVVIIGIIILLTFYSQGRRDKRDDDIMLTSGQFQADLDNALGAVTVALSPDRAGRSASVAQSVERLASRFDTNSQELIHQLQIEHDRLENLASRREKEFADFAIFASGMRAGAEETHRLLIDLRQVSTALQNALDDLTSEVGMAGDQQRTLLQAVSNLERLVASGIQSDQAVTRQLSDASMNIAEAADRAMAGSEAAAQAGRVATEAVRGIADVASILADSQNRVEQAMATESEANSRLADALRGSIGGVSQSTKQLTDISGVLTQLRDEFERLSNQSFDQTSALSAILDKESGVAGQLTQASRDLSSSAIAVAQRQREIKDEVSALMQQLDSVTNTLHRFANHLPTPENMQHAFSNALRDSNGQPALPPLTAGQNGPGAQNGPSRRPEPVDAANRPSSERPSLWPSSTRRPGQ